MPAPLTYAALQAAKRGDPFFPLEDPFLPCSRFRARFLPTRVVPFSLYPFLLDPLRNLSSTPRTADLFSAEGVVSRMARERQLGSCFLADRRTRRRIGGKGRDVLSFAVKNYGYVTAVVRPLRARILNPVVECWPPR